MDPIKPFFAGVALFAAGLAKVWLHLNSTVTMTVPGCLGSDFTIELSSSSAHCWGCYVAVLGAGIMMLTLVAAIGAHKDARSAR